MKRYDEEIANHMFDIYCHEEWMQEKYVPTRIQQRLRERYDEIQSLHRRLSEFIATGQILSEVSPFPLLNVGREWLSVPAPFERRRGVALRVAFARRPHLQLHRQSPLHVLTPRVSRAPRSLRGRPGDLRGPSADLPSLRTLPRRLDLHGHGGICREDRGGAEQRDGVPDRSDHAGDRRNEAELLAAVSLQAVLLHSRGSEHGGICAGGFIAV